MSRKQPKPSTSTEHGDLIIYPPLEQPHTSTLIFLHGRGDSGPNVSPHLCDFRIIDSSELSLRQLLPNTKFVIPTALKRNVGNTGMEWNQWFDISSLKDTVLEEENQIEGLSESTGYIHGLIRDEIEVGELIDESKVIVMGLSQGCAIGALSSLLWPGRLGGFIGMSGWLPLIGQIESKLTGGDEALVEMLKHISKVVSFEESSTSVTKPLEMLKTPVFLGHGTEDMTVAIQRGEDLRDAFQGIGFEDLSWKTYHYGHWWCSDEIEDIVNWLNEKGFQTAKEKVEKAQKKEKESRLQRLLDRI